MLRLLAGIGALAAATPLYETSFVAPVVNEGWLALIVTAWRHGAPLYPSADEFFVANYLPLAYWPYRLLEAAFGDIIFAGRWFSWILFAAICACAGAIAWRATMERAAAATAAIMVFSTFAVWFGGNLGLAEPQFLGHLLALTGVLVLASGDASLSRLSVATALLLLAGLVKPNLFGFPLGVALWLLCTDRRRFVAWLAASAVAVLAASAALYAAYGPDLFFANVLLERIYSSNAFLNNLRSLRTIALPLIICLVLRRRLLSAAHGKLVVCLLAGAAVEFLATGTTEGTTIGTVYDLALIASIGAAIALAGNRSEASGRTLTNVFLLLLVVRAAAALAPRPDETILSSQHRRAVQVADENGRRVVQMLAAIPGEAACSDLSYCYWAHKRARIDLGLMPIRFFVTGRAPAVLLRALESSSITAVVLHHSSRAVDVLPPLGEVLAQYPVHAAIGGPAEQGGLFLMRASTLSRSP